MLFKFAQKYDTLTYVNIMLIQFIKINENFTENGLKKVYLLI